MSGGGNSAGRTDELNGNHRGSGNAFDASAHIHLHVVVVAFEQGALLPLFPAFVIAIEDFNRVAAERLKVPIALELFPDSRTADLQNIRLGEQRLRLESFTHGSTEACTIVERHIRTITATDLHLHRHGLQVRENLNLCQFKTVRCSCAGSNGNDVRQEWMGQGLVERVIRAQARWLML